MEEEGGGKEKTSRKRLQDVFKIEERFNCKKNTGKGGMVTVKEGVEGVSMYVSECMGEVCVCVCARHSMRDDLTYSCLDLHTSMFVSLFCVHSAWITGLMDEQHHTDNNNRTRSLGL